MIIRILLLLGVGAVFAWFLRQRISTRTQAWSKLGVLFLFAAAIAAILFPNLTNEWANAVGVGRGADLLLYIVTIIFLAFLLVHYMHRRDDQGRMVRLARHIAIVEANNNTHNQEIIRRALSGKAAEKSR